jgi:hypothetical protein
MQTETAAITYMHSLSNVSNRSSASSVSSLHLPDIPTTICVRSPARALSDPTAQSVLGQAELVYDGLLADRQGKLQAKIDKRREEYSAKVDELQQTDAQKAAEFKRWSDAALEQYEIQCADELCQLRQDYEMKFARLQRSMLEQQQQQQQLQQQQQQQRAAGHASRVNY